MGVAAGLNGSAVLTHNSTPGALTAVGAIANFSTNFSEAINFATARER
jgi:hypothetical protein